jgi:hypothetical protein
MKIKYRDLVELLKSQKGAKPVTICAQTIPNMRKKDNPYKDVIKISRVNGIIGCVYTNAVNRQRIREDSDPDFEAEPRKWGQRIIGTPLVEHKGKYYLELKVEKSLGHEYELYNERIPFEKIKEFLRLPPDMPKQGLDKEVILRDYDLANITSITINDQYYEIIK